MNKIGIDSKKFLLHIQRLHNVWEHYFWQSKVCQGHIRFTDEQKTNYVPDLLNYFEDTIVLLARFRKGKDYRESLYHIVATLQFMYIQQDLMDELLLVFKLPQSSKHKRQARDLRNELTGHPVSRGTNNELVSSVFITAQSKENVLEYARYHKDNNFKFDLRSYNWQQIFADHNLYLEHYFAELEKKISSILRMYQKSLRKLLESTRKIEFTKLVHWVNTNLEIFHKDTHVYNQKAILHYHSLAQTHLRYKNIVENYLSGLEEYLTDKINDIDEVLKPIVIKKRDKPLPALEISFLDMRNFDTTEDAIIIRSHRPANKSYHHEYGKLHQRHDIYDIAYFKREFHNDEEIMDELNNMEINGYGSAEFYCSYEYLGLLLRKRNLLL